MNDLVLLIDFDGTLFDSGAAKRTFGDWLATQPWTVGRTSAERFWELYESLRSETGSVDWATAISLYSAESAHPDAAVDMEAFLSTMQLDPFALPGAEQALTELSQFGTTVIFSDGVEPYQRDKIERSRFASLVAGRVAVYAGKTRRFGEMRTRFPASYYVVVDDRPAVLDAARAELGPYVTTVLLCDVDPGTIHLWTRDITAVPGLLTALGFRTLQPASDG